MRLLSWPIAAAFAAAFAAAATAQSPLTTTFLANAGGTGNGAVYCDLAAAGTAVTVTDFDLNFSQPPGATGSVDVYVTPTTFMGVERNPAAWTMHGTAAVAATAGFGAPSSCALSPPLLIPAGVTIGVAFVANGLTHVYTVAAASLPLAYEACPLKLTAGAAANTPFGQPVFAPRIVNTNIRFTYAGDCGTVAVQGDGCVAEFCSFHETMAPSTMDLSGQTVQASSFGGGYVVSAQPGSTAAVGSLATPVMLPLGDDDQIAAGTLGLVVGSNCWIALGAGNSNGFQPSVTTMLGNPAAAIYSWTDLEPNAPGSGQVSYEEDAPNGLARVTYDGVFGWGTTIGNTVQFDYDATTGDFAITWGALSANNPEPWLVGFSCSGPSADPGPRDLSSATPFVVADVDVEPLSLSPTSGPALQDPASAVDVLVTTEGISATALLHIGIVGLARQAVPLGPLGLPPSCSLTTSLELLAAAAAPGPGQSSFTWTALTLPPLPPSFAGLEFDVQAATLGAGGLDGEARTSNGLKYFIGTL